MAQTLAIAEEQPLAISEEKPLAIAEEKAAPTATSKALSTATDLVKGAVKGAGQTITTLGTYARKIPGVSALDKVMTPVEFSTTPTNTAQSIGKAGEQVAEFFLPSSLSGKATAYLVGALPASKWAVGIARAIPEAASAYAVSKAQGDPNAKTSAAIAGLIPGGAAVVSASRAGARLAAGAERSVGAAFQATDKSSQALAKRVAGDVLSGKHGSVWSLTLRALEDRADRMTQGIGEKIEEQIQQHAGLDFTDAIDGIVAHMEHAKDAYRAKMPLLQVGFGEIAQHEAVLWNTTKVRTINALQDKLTTLKDAGAATLENLIGARRAWDEIVSDAGGFAERGRTGLRADRASLKEKTAAWAHREGVRAIRMVLSDDKFLDLNKLQKLNAQYSFWTTIQDLTERALTRQTDTAGRMSKALGIATGALVGEQAGQRSQYGGWTGAAAGALMGGTATGATVGNLVVMASRSPAWRLASAKVKETVAEAIMSGRVDRASKILGRFTAAEAAGSPKATP